MRSILSLIPAIFLALLVACGQTAKPSTAETATNTPTTTITAETEPSPEIPEQAETSPYPISKTDREWREQLTAEEYYILRRHGTERPFSGDLLNNKKTGTYICAACQNPLFSSDTKFKSGTGWPSFYQPIEGGKVGETIDDSYGMIRTEVHCNRCGGHLGHVFDDGPAPTGLRYCINAVSLDFIAAK